MSASQAYSCPDHPDVVQEHPGTCPRCHNPLLPKSEESLPNPVEEPAE